MYIEVKNAVKKYGSADNCVYALHNASLSVERGEICVILGHSGSGKSTLLNMIGGLDTLNSGSIDVAGYTISDFSSKQLIEYRRENVGFVFQFYNLIPDLTVAENIKVIADISKEPLDVDELLKILGIDMLASRFPNEISGGQQQRVAIARAMIKKPKVLLCDELTGSLDSSSARDVLRLVQEVNRAYGTTILIVTHNAEIKKMADRYVHIRDGKVVVNEVQTEKAGVTEMNL
ncbi:MAG: ABC transporter ATP-binding protein [Saccharofermentanales bacterium]|jgi:putative ABC transport system ATP-binding protein